MKSVSMEDGKTTFESQLKKSGFVGAKENRMSPENTLCDFETHIEQGPILDDAGKDLGVVDCVFCRCKSTVVSARKNRCP